MQCGFDGVLRPQGFCKDANPTLSANSGMHEELFSIVDQNVPITLSGSVAERLGFICRIQNVQAEKLYPVAQSYADVFAGLGQLKGVEYTMKLNPRAVGVVVPEKASSGSTSSKGQGGK